MSEALLGEQMERMAGQAERSIEKAATARAELVHVGDLLTALGVATRAAAPHNNTRTLTLTERIMALDRRNPSVMFLGGGGMGGASADDEPSACEEEVPERDRLYVHPDLPDVIENRRQLPLDGRAAVESAVTAVEPEPEGGS